MEMRERELVVLEERLGGCWFAGPGSLLHSIVAEEHAGRRSSEYPRQRFLEEPDNVSEPSLSGC